MELWGVLIRDGGIFLVEGGDASVAGRSMVGGADVFEKTQAQGARDDD